MPDPHNNNNQNLIANFVDNPIIALTNAILVLSTGKFLHAVRTGIRCKPINCGLKGCSDICGKSVQLPLSLRSDKDFILHGYRLSDETGFDGLPQDVSLLFCFSNCETRIFEINAIFHLAQQLDILNRYDRDQRLASPRQDNALLPIGGPVDDI